MPRCDLQRAARQSPMSERRPGVEAIRQHRAVPVLWIGVVTVAALDQYDDWQVNGAPRAVTDLEHALAAEVRALRSIVEPFSGFATTANAHRMKRQDKSLAAAMAALDEWSK